MYTLSVANVAAIAKAARSTAPRTKAEAYRLVETCNRSLREASAGELALAEGVRLPMPLVIKLIWKVRQQALAQWKAAKAKAAEEAAVLEQLDEDRRGEHFEYLALLGQVV